MDIQQVALNLKCISERDLDLPIIVLRGVWNAGATSNINSRWKHPIQLWKPMQAQPLSNCVLRACAYQEQGKGKWALPNKMLPRLWTTIWQRKDVWKTLFSKQILRNYQPCVSTPKTPEHHKERVNQKKHCQSQLMPNTFILQLWRNIPLTIMTSIELRLLNTCCITQKVRC